MKKLPHRFGMDAGPKHPCRRTFAGSQHRASKLFPYIQSTKRTPRGMKLLSVNIASDSTKEERSVRLAKTITLFVIPSKGVPLQWVRPTGLAKKSRSETNIIILGTAILTISLYGSHKVARPSAEAKQVSVPIPIYCLPCTLCTVISYNIIHPNR